MGQTDGDSETACRWDSEGCDGVRERKRSESAHDKTAKQTVCLQPCMDISERVERSFLSQAERQSAPFRTEASCFPCCLIALL